MILNNPPIVLLYFSTFGGSIFDLKSIFFRCFFESDFKTYFFGFGVDFLSKLEAKWEPKLIKTRMKVLVDF